MNKRTAIAVGIVAAALVALGLNAGTLMVTLDAKTAAPTTVNLSGVSAAAGTSLSFAAADHVHSITGTVPGARGGTGVSGSPYLGATSAAGQTINNTTSTTVVFGTVETDSDSAYNSGTGVFTVPTGKGGQYFVSCSIAYSSALAASDVEIDMQVNGTTKRIGLAVNPATNQTLTVAAVVNPTAGQTIQCVAFQNAGVSKTLTADARFVVMTIKRLPD